MGILRTNSVIPGLSRNRLHLRRFMRLPVLPAVDTGLISHELKSKRGQGRMAVIIRIDHDRLVFVQPGENDAQPIFILYPTSIYYIG